jgi:aromatic-L-amino-acid decarboxylase
MDWAAHLLGLGHVFMNASQVGGGVIHVCNHLKFTTSVVAEHQILLQTTASDSALTAVVAARSSYQRDHPDVKAENLIIYTTTQTHSLGAKAGLVLGLKVREIEVKLEDQLALRGQALRTALEEDTRNGLHPFILSELPQAVSRSTECTHHIYII